MLKIIILIIMWGRNDNGHKWGREKVTKEKVFNLRKKNSNKLFLTS